MTQSGHWRRCMMTQYEALDLAQSTFGNSIAAYAVFLSIVSGYLITAYLVGSKLSRAQVRLLTLLFLIIVSILIWSMSAYAYWGDAFSNIARPEGVEQSKMGTQPWLPAFLAAVNSFTVAAFIVFMWNIRHPKRTDDKIQ